MKLARGGSCPSGQHRGPTAAGDDKFPSPDQQSFQPYITPTHRGRKWQSPGVDTAPYGVETPSHRLTADRLGLTAHIEPARGESRPSGQGQGPAENGEDNIPSPDPKHFDACTTPAPRGQNKLSPGSIPPRTVWEPHPNRRIADRLGLMKPVRGKSCPSGQRRGTAAPGDDKLPSSDQRPFKHLPLQHPGDANSDPLGRYCLARRGNPIPIGGLLIVDRLRLTYSQHAARVSSRDNAPPHSGKLSFHPQIRNHFMHLYNSNRPRGRKRRSLRSIPPRMVWKTQPRSLNTD